MAEVLDIRKELERPLRGFRVAIGEFSREIESADWEPDFAEEAELVFREQIEPEVDEIDEAVRQNKGLMELARKVGRHGFSFGGMGAVIGNAAGLPSLTGLVFGVGISLFQAGVDLNEKFESIKGNQLYFYYHAREVMRR